MWYRADYLFFNPNNGKSAFADADYYECNNDSDAIEIALAGNGEKIHIDGVGLLSLSLAQVYEVDVTKDGSPIIRTIYT